MSAHNFHLKQKKMCVAFNVCLLPLRFNYILCHVLYLSLFILSPIKNIFFLPLLDAAITVERRSQPVCNGGQHMHGAQSTHAKLHGPRARRKSFGLISGTCANPHVYG